MIITILGSKGSEMVGGGMVVPGCVLSVFKITHMPSGSSS